MKLKEYLNKHHISFREMERIANVSYGTLFNITKGSIPIRKIADIIVQKTQGEVTHEDLGFINIDGQWVKPYGKIQD